MKAEMKLLIREIITEVIEKWHNQKSVGSSTKGSTVQTVAESIDETSIDILD
jgi:hypothetical protein